MAEDHDQPDPAGTTDPAELLRRMDRVLARAEESDKLATVDPEVLLTPREAAAVAALPEKVDKIDRILRGHDDKPGLLTNFALVVAIVKQNRGVLVLIGTAVAGIIAKLVLGALGG